MASKPPPGGFTFGTAMFASGTFRTWPVWLTMSVHEAKAEVSFETPEVR